MRAGLILMLDLYLFVAARGQCASATAILSSVSRTDA